jgi:hypothetical protein
MGIEIDFGRELGRLAFPDDITEEQAQNYARENYQAIRQGLIAKRQEELAAETEAEEKAKFQLGQVSTVQLRLCSTLFLSYRVGRLRESAKPSRG